MGSTPGTYRITQASGCYRPAARGKWTSSDLRVSYPNRDRLGTPVGIAWANRGEFQTEQECVRTYRGASRVIHHGGGSASFWVADVDAKDNTGKLTLRYEQLDDPTGITTSLTCDATTTALGRVVTVRGTSSPALADTPIAVALPTGRSPVRFLVNTDRTGAFRVDIPLAYHPTDTLAVDALWPVPDTSVAAPHTPCAIPISGTAPGFRSTSGFAYSRTGTPNRPYFFPEDPYASARVRVNFSEIPPMPMEIGRLEYDTNPTGVATPKRGLRFARIVTDADLAFVKNGIVRFTLLKPEVTKLGATATNVVVARFDAEKRRWVEIATTTVANRGSMTIAEAFVPAADLRDSTFALMAKR